MSKSVKITITVLLCLIIAAAAGFGIYRTFQGEVNTPASNAVEENDVKETTDQAEEKLDETELSPTVPDPNTEGEVDNSTLAQEIEPPISMEEVVNANADALTTDLGDVSSSYPSQLIPLFHMSELGDVSDITSGSGKPGWKLIYGSNSGTEDIASFYESLLTSQNGYQVIEEGSSHKINASTQGYNVSITTSPNNAQRTGLSSQTSVQIFIEQQ